MAEELLLPDYSLDLLCFDVHISGKTGLKKDAINLRVMPRQDARSQLLDKEN